jgi:hypothetical protein
VARGSGPGAFSSFNAFIVTSENVRKLRIYLHSKMVDFSKAVIVEVNGKVLAKVDVQPSLKTMLELARATS